MSYNTNFFPFARTCCSPLIFGSVRDAHLCIFLFVLCVVVFVCLRPVSCVPSVAYFLDCPFLIAPSVFSNIYFTQAMSIHTCTLKDGYFEYFVNTRGLTRCLTNMHFENIPNIIYSYDISCGQFQISYRY